MRLLLTRPLEEGDAFRKELEAKGHSVVSLPLLRIEPPADGGKKLCACLARIRKYHWLVLTSQNGVRAVARFLPELPSSLSIVAGGAQTRALAEQFGWRVFLASPKLEGEKALQDFFARQEVDGEKILFPTSQIPRAGWVPSLQTRGAQIDVVEAYRTVPADVSSEQIRTVLQQPLDTVLLFSPSAVQVFFDHISPADPLLKNIRFIPKGETTAQALRHRGIPADRIYNASGII